MKECSKNFIDVIISELSKAPENYGEKYDTIVEISKLDTPKISSFIQEVYALDKYYLRPTSEKV